MFAARQDRVFGDETGTPGYAVLNLDASHIWPRQHIAHVLSFTGYNLTNALFRNHMSFIKDLAPAMGRGVKAGYSLRFFGGDRACETDIAGAQRLRRRRKGRRRQLVSFRT